MAERTDQRTRDAEADLEELLDEPGSTDEEVTDSEGSGGLGLRDRLPSPFSGLFSLRAFLVVLALTVVASLLTAPLPLPGTGLIGVFLVGFGTGALRGESRYLELLVAGAVASGVATLFNFLLVSVLGPGLALTAVGASAGALAAVVGHYFGRDLRDGLTRDI